MAKNYRHPHWEIEVIDNSIYTPQIVSNLPLFRPIFWLRAAQGPVGVPVWVEDYTDAVAKYGEATFSNSTKFFSLPALYLRNIFEKQGAFMVRVANADATYGSLVLCLQVKKVKVPQWQVDENGQYMRDPDSAELLPEDDGHGGQVSEDGVELKWTVRPLNTALDRPETITSLKPVSYGAGDQAYTVYPILAAKAKYVGSYANDIGLKFYVADEGLDTDLANNVGSIPYTFGIVKKTYGQDTVSPVPNSLGQRTSNFVCKQKAVDNRFSKRVSFEDMIEQYYGSADFDVHLYSENIETIGALVQEYEQDDPTLTDPYLVNLTEPYNMNAVPMRHVVFSTDPDAVNLTDSRILYLADGKDGDISDETVETLTRQYLKDDIYPELFDQARYPFTHIIDTGVSLATKKAYIQFLGKHDAHKCILATQDCTTGRFNTKDEDISMGQALQAELVLQPESVAYGTGCCRAEVYLQAAYLADNTVYNGIVPTTLDIARKKTEYMSTTVMRRAPAGSTDANIDLFKPESWVYSLSTPDQKELAWSGGLNYFQHSGMHEIFWPALHSVYAEDTSVLSSAAFVDAVVITKHLAREAWSKFSGMEFTFSEISASATSYLSSLLAKTFSNSPYTYTVEFQQSEEEKNIGYISHAIINLTAPAQQRVWKIDIVCNRDGYSPEE